jgi:hypothetical protein
MGSDGVERDRESADSPQEKLTFDPEAAGGRDMSN